MGVVRSKNGNWTEEEDKFLIENYPIKGATYCSENLENRTLEAVRSRAKLLNLKSQYRQGGWSDKEIMFLLKNYEVQGAKYCSMYLKDRTYDSIVRKANKLGLKQNKK